MALPNLSGSNIQDTFQRVLQTDGGDLRDGTGSLVTLNNITASGNINAGGNVYATEYFVDDVISLSHPSSNLLAVGNATAWHEIQLGHSTQTNRIDLQGNVTASGNISASGDLYFNNIDGGTF